MIALLDFVKKKNEQVILVGDTNICVLTESYKYTRLKEFMSLFNLHSALNQPTRITGTCSSSIDNVITDLPTNLYKTETIKTLVSDHFATSITLSIPQNTKKNAYKK